MTCDNWVFKMGKKMKSFSFLNSNYLSRTTCNTYETIYILKELPHLYSKT